MSFYLSNAAVGNNKKKFLERMYSTKKLVVKDMEYVWIVYRNLYPARISGLLLYNLKAGKEEDNKQVIEDMLKILYAYMAIYKGQFYQKLPQFKKWYGREVNKIRNSIGPIEKKLSDIYLQPNFIRTLIQESLNLAANVLKSENAISRNLDRIIEIGKLIDMEYNVPIKLLLSFYSELQEYYQTILELEEKAKGKENILAEIKAFTDVFSKESDFGDIGKLLELVYAHIENLKFYKKFPLINDLILYSFSEQVLEPYKPLIRNMA